MKNIGSCIVVGVVVGSILASITRELWLTGVGAGIGVGVGPLFDRTGIMNNKGVGAVSPGIVIGASVGAVAASITKEWWLTGMGVALGVGVSGGIAAYLARTSRRDG